MIYSRGTNLASDKTRQDGTTSRKLVVNKITKFNSMPNFQAIL